MKKILIVSDSLRTGGIQTSLINFLNVLSKENIDITLFLFNDEGFKNNLLNEKIKIKFGSKLLQTISSTSNYAKKRGLLLYAIRKVYALFCKIFTSKVMYSLVFKFERKLRGYDVVLSYSNNVSNNSVYFGYNLFCLRNVDALKKFAYVHVDYHLIHNKYTDLEYSKFDKIWFVSEYSKQTFLKYNSRLKNRCDVIYNFIDLKKLNNISSCPYDKNVFNIVTVGRLDDNKSQIDAIAICKKLKNDKFNFKWYFLGEGPNKKKIYDEMSKNNLEENICLCGNVSNVNDYLYYADLCVSFSKSESYGLAIAESLILNCITMSRNIPVIDELIKNGINGIICDVDEMYLYIKRLMTDKKYYKKFKNNAKLDYDYSKNLINVLSQINE